MAKLRDSEKGPGYTTNWYTHDDTKVTIETVQDVEPVFESAKYRSEAQNPKSSFRFKAEIPHTLLMEECKREAERCGLRPHEMLSEALRGQTDRAKKIWRKLSEDRDFNKLHAKTYRR